MTALPAISFAAGRILYKAKYNCRLLLVKRGVLDMHKRNQGTLEKHVFHQSKYRRLHFKISHISPSFHCKLM